MECLLESMVAIFEHIGGVPTEIWFDNTKTIVKTIIRGGGREVTDRFLRFQEHYGFKPVFCNPDAGNEKGGVLSAYFFYPHILKERCFHCAFQFKICG
jgi:transposase